MEEKYIQQFKKGAYEMILLSLIAQKETYGYEILTEIQKQGGEIFAFAKEGTIYPILYRLTKAGLIQYRLVPAKANGGEKNIIRLPEREKICSKKWKISGKTTRIVWMDLWKGMRNMNRETYIRKVKKQLDCSVKEKEEIVRDLQEILILEKSMEKAKARS